MGQTIHRQQPSTAVHLSRPSQALKRPNSQTSILSTTGGVSQLSLPTQSQKKDPVPCPMVKCSRAPPSLPPSPKRSETPASSQIIDCGNLQEARRLADQPSANSESHWPAVVCWPRPGGRAALLLHSARCPHCAARTWSTAETNEPASLIWGPKYPYLPAHCLVSPRIRHIYGIGAVPKRPPHWRHGRRSSLPYQPFCVEPQFGIVSAYFFHSQGYST